MHSSSSTDTRSIRHERILALVADSDITSQAELRERLAGEGLEVNQATLSRDLRALGVAKGPSGYVPPMNGIRGSLPSAARQWLVSAESAQNQVILRTPPSGAQPLALAIDEAQLAGVLGTIAGDDTILLIAADTKAARAVVTKLLEYLPQRKAGQ